jgi:histone H3/H4
MTLADSHVKNLLKEGTGRAGSPPSGSDWRISPEAITAAKAKAEEYLRALGEQSARNCAAAKRSTLKAEDVADAPSAAAAPAPEPTSEPPSDPWSR